MTNAEDFIKDFEELALPHEILDRYDIIEQLAQTDYGETFLISEKESGKRCVLKCYKKSDTHESELLRGLKHKGLPCFIGEFETEDTLFVLREYIDGTTLDEYLTEHRLNEEQTTDIIIELCEILSYLHNQPIPIIHRDIKPSNIVINPNDGRVTLIDFGISRKYSEDAETDTVFIGTQKFAPPEQYGFSQTDCRTDIYALGVVLRYMLTGMVDGKTTVKDKSLARIIAKCTAFSPSDRYKNAAALKKSLSNHRKHTTKKIAVAITTLITACFVFAGGFAVGRYTDVLQPVAVEETPYTFVEPLIEKAARLMLNKNDTEPILRGELKDITRLYVAGQEAAATTEEWDNIKSKFFEENKPFGAITRLDDVALMENLQSLNLYGQNVLYDISPLAELQRLEHADITHCNINDASPLENLPRLNSLNLFDNVITDFSCFGRMKALTHLGVGKMTLRRISELGEVLHVESLDLRGTQIESLDGIENFYQLAYLIISETAIRDFSPLDSLQNLKEVWISADMEQYSGTLKNVEIVIS